MEIYPWFSSHLFPLALSTPLLLMVHPVDFSAFLGLSPRFPQWGSSAKRRCGWFGQNMTAAETGRRNNLVLLGMVGLHRCRSNLADRGSLSIVVPYDLLRLTNSLRLLVADWLGIESDVFCGADS